MTCLKGYRCRACRETICAPCDLGQPACEHGEDLCDSCSAGDCMECALELSERGAA